MSKTIINGKSYIATNNSASSIIYINSKGIKTSVQQKINELEQKKVYINDMALTTINEKINYIVKKIESDSKIPKVYNLETVTNIKAAFPNDYQNFTVDNFIVEISYPSVSGSSSWSDWVAAKSAVYVGNVSKTISYNNETGQLLISGTITTTGNLLNYWNSTRYDFTTGTGNIIFNIYVVNGEIIKL